MTWINDARYRAVFYQVLAIGLVVALAWSMFATASANLAKQDIGHIIRDAGWHFSWMGDLNRFAAKLNAYAHQEHAQSFGEQKMADVASFLSSGSAIPEGAPGAREGYEVVPVDRHPRLVRDRLDRFRTMGWIR